MNYFLQSTKPFGFEQRTFILWCLALAMIWSATGGEALAVTVEALREPMRGLKTEVFGGWMYAAKIGACTVGAVLSVMRNTLVPFGIGAGVLAGIIFFDRYLGDGAAGALI